MHVDLVQRLVLYTKYTGQDGWESINKIGLNND